MSRHDGPPDKLLTGMVLVLLLVMAVAVGMHTAWLINNGYITWYV